MDYRHLTSPCGIDCFNCLAYKAQDDEKLRMGIAERFGIPPEHAACRGCRNEGGCIALVNMKGPCYVWKCIQEKGHEFCYECPNFPCEHLAPVADRCESRPHNMKVYNLCIMKRDGVEEWTRQAAHIREHYFRGNIKLSD